MRRPLCESLPQDKEKRQMSGIHIIQKAIDIIKAGNYAIAIDVLEDYMRDAEPPAKDKEGQAITQHAQGRGEDAPKLSALYPGEPAVFQSEVELEEVLKPCSRCGR
jgi:hypothetical protein